MTAGGAFNSLMVSKHRRIKVNGAFAICVWAFYNLLFSDNSHLLHLPNPVNLRQQRIQLKPLVRSDYPVTFTDDQWARLQAAFPDGVADWTKPDPEATPNVPWLTYKDGPGGQPM